MSEFLSGFPNSIPPCQARLSVFMGSSFLLLFTPPRFPASVPQGQAREAEGERYKDQTDEVTSERGRPERESETRQSRDLHPLPST